MGRECSIFGCALRIWESSSLFKPMKRNASRKTFNQSKRQHVENTTSCFSSIPEDLLIRYLDSDDYNSMMRVDKGTNLIYKRFRSLILDRFTCNEFEYSVLTTRLAIMFEKRIAVAKKIWNEIGANKTHGKLDNCRVEHIRKTFDMNPVCIFICNIPASWVAANELPCRDLSVELALQGYPDRVVRKHIRDDDFPYKFSNWSPSAKINLRGVRKLWTYHNFESAIEDPKFARLVYNQPNMELLDLYDKWRNLEWFLRYREVSYTENDLKRFNATPEMALQYNIVKIIPPLWLFKHVFDGLDKKPSKCLLKKIFKFECITDTRWIWDTRSLSHLLLNGKMAEHIEYFKKIGLWRPLLKFVFKRPLPCKEIFFLVHCDFTYTQNYCKKLNIDFANMEDIGGLVSKCHHTPPVWVFERKYPAKNIDETDWYYANRRDWVRWFCLEGMFRGELPEHEAFFRQFENFVWDDKY